MILQHKLTQSFSYYLLYLLTISGDTAIGKLAEMCELILLWGGGEGEQVINS